MKMMKSIYRKFAKRTLLLILIVHFAVLSFAATYFVSNSGNDTNSGLTQAMPWKTLAKVNAATFVAGDNILFKKGDTFYGSITVKNSGTAGNPITFGAYGTGVNPIITGFTTVTGWTNKGGNIWESTNAVSTLLTCNMVTINNVNTPMGRFPNFNDANDGYLYHQSHTTTSITSSTLTGTPDWTGATLCLMSNEYILSRRIITSQSASTLNWSSNINTISKAEFFIQNDLRTLDAENEWYYNPTTKKIIIYSTSTPSNVKVASVEYLVEYAKNGSNYSLCSYINIESITFTGSNNNTFHSYQSLVIGHRLHDTNISNCEISFSGLNGIRLNSDDLSVENTTIRETNGSAINANYSGIVSLKNNSLSEISLIKGVGGEYGDCAIIATSIVSGNIEGNSITNCGFNGISFDGSSIITVKNNYISSFNSKLQDGGAITTGGAKAIGTSIIGNICIGGDGIDGLICGIYLDDNSSNTEVANNTVANCSWVGIYLHNVNNNNIHNNTVFNCGYAQLRTADDNLGGDIYSNIISDNQFISKTATQNVAAFQSNKNNITKIGTFNNNYYSRPIDDNVTIYTWQPLTLAVYRTLTEWKIFSNQDFNSQKISQAITSENDLQFEYNATSIAKIITLSRPMIDVKGAKYYNSVTLKPYTSIVLMRDPSPIVPIVPIFVEALIENNAPTNLEMTYNVNLANVVPAASAFSVKVNSLVRIVNSVSILGTKVMLTLDSPLFYSDIVTVDYNKPSVKPIQTISEGQAASLSSQSVINNVAILKQGSVVPTHFIPVWQGENGLNHMNIMVVSAMFEDLPLLPEIGRAHV